MAQLPASKMNYGLINISIYLCFNFTSLIRHKEMCLDKCEVLHVTHARDHTSYPYKLSGCTLQSVTETVDLGVSLTSNLSRNTQTQKVVNKANKIVGFLKRNVGLGNKEVFSRLYKALVIPILEYFLCCPSLVTLFTEEH